MTIDSMPHRLHFQELSTGGTHEEAALLGVNHYLLCSNRGLQAELLLRGASCVYSGIHQSGGAMVLTG